MLSRLRSLAEGSEGYDGFLGSVGQGSEPTAVGEVMAWSRPMAVMPSWGELEGAEADVELPWLSDGLFFFLW